MRCARGLLDQPGERRSHAWPTPRGGGIGIVVALLVALVVLAWRGRARRRCAGAGVRPGWCWSPAIGWLDDHRPLSAVVAAGRACARRGPAGARAAGAPARARPVAVRGFVLALVLVNVWNFMDGIDGLAASQALLVAAGLRTAGRRSAVARWLALVAGARPALGFLPFNFPRARIFLGDVGSGALGYVLALPAAGAVGAGRAAAGWPGCCCRVSAFLVDAA